MTKSISDELRVEWYKSNIQGTRELGFFALKSLITLNSGAFVVLLTFIGNAQAQAAFVVSVGRIQSAMYSFLAGISFAFIVVALAYVNSIMLSPYDSSRGLPDKLAIPLYVLIAAISLGVFVFGVYQIASGVSVK